MTQELWKRAQKSLLERAPRGSSVLTGAQKRSSGLIGAKTFFTAKLSG